MGEEETSEIQYNCVFLKQGCPVRAYFKLRPESLVEFCKTCPIIEDRTDAAKKTEDKNMAMVFNLIQVAATQLGGFFQAQMNEKMIDHQRLLDLVEKLALAKA